MTGSSHDIQSGHWHLPSAAESNSSGSVPGQSLLFPVRCRYKDGSSIDPRVCMKILIYKRTHQGDPDRLGRFGIERCMGRVRAFPFDAVIGVGGISGWPQADGIARKVNWVGRNPRRRPNPIDDRGPLVTFRRGDFRLMEDRGPLLASMSRLLAAAVYNSRNRFIFSSVRGKLAAEAQRVITELLDTDRYPDTPTGGSAIPGSCGVPRCRPPRKATVKPISRARRSCKTDCL